MKFILLTISMISVSCGTEVVAEPGQKIVIQEAEKPIVLTSIEDLLI
jgi:hypothetical protein